MLLRVQIAVSLAVLLGLAALVQTIVAARAVSRLFQREHLQDAIAVAKRVALEVDACASDDPCIAGIFRHADRSYGVDSAGLYASGRRQVGTGPEVEPVAGMTWASVPTQRGDVVVRLVSDGRWVGSAQTATAATIWLTAMAAFVGAMLLMERAVLAPVRRLTQAAERASRLEVGPFFVPGTGPVLGGLAATLDRSMRSLEEERARTLSQVQELAAVNGRLAEARDSLVAAEKLATVGRLAAGIAHEVGNPLGAILGYLEMARSRGAGDSQVIDCLDRIEAEIRRIDTIVRHLLAFARPAPIRLGPTALPNVIDAAVRLASMPARAREVEVIRDIPADLPLVLAEEQRLAQVLVNLLFNAADAMNGKGRVEITARTDTDHRPARRADDPPAGPRVLLTVSDHGPGIAPDQIQRIFDPFFTTKEPGHGTGLGLAICHGILESFGGEIRAANRIGGGAEFSLVLRVAPTGA